MDNPLQAVPLVIRRVLYAAAVVAIAWYGALEAANDDWKAAIPIFLTALVPLLALGNSADPPSPYEPGDPHG